MGQAPGKKKKKARSIINKVAQRDNNKVSFHGVPYLFEILDLEQDNAGNTT